MSGFSWAAMATSHVTPEQLADAPCFEDIEDDLKAFCGDAVIVAQSADRQRRLLGSCSRIYGRTLTVSADKHGPMQSLISTGACITGWVSIEMRPSMGRLTGPSRGRT